MLFFYSWLLDRQSSEPPEHTGLIFICPNEIWEQSGAKFLYSSSCLLHLSCTLAWVKVTRDPNTSWELSVLELLESAEKSLIGMRTVPRLTVAAFWPWWYQIPLYLWPTIDLVPGNMFSLNYDFFVSIRSETKDKLCLRWLAKTLRNLEWDVPVAAYFKYVMFHPRVFPQTTAELDTPGGCAPWSLWPRCPIKRNW